MSSRNPQLRIGMVGSGMAARFHAETWRRIVGVDCEVAGVISRTPENAERYARDFECRAFESIESLAEACDVLDICTPPYAHESTAILAAEAGKHVLVEKPYTGAFGPGDEDWNGFDAPKEPLMDEAMASCRRMRQAFENSDGILGYAENFVFAPGVQKEREMIEKSGAQILWARGEQSHNGSHSHAYGFWRLAGGGSLIGKGVHPLTAILYLKRAEGEASNGKPIRPKSISCNTHRLTELPGFRDIGEFRTGYNDIEDAMTAHITFDDGTIADVLAGELVMGGLHNWLEIMCHNHRTRINLSPTNVCVTYNPVEEQFEDIEVVEKISTKQGWNFPSPDENYFHGVVQELQHFAECFAHGREPMSGIELAEDTTATVYAGYVSAERSGANADIPRLAG